MMKKNTIGNLIDPEMKEEVKNTFKENHHIYNKRKTTIQAKCDRRKGDVESKIFEVNKRNIEVNVLDSLTNRQIPKAIISVLFASEEPQKLIGIFAEIERIANKTMPDEIMEINAHSLRNHLGAIMRSDIKDYIDMIPRGSKSARYRVHPKHKNAISVEEAYELFKTTMRGYGSKGKQRYESKKEVKKEEENKNPENKDGCITVSFKGKECIKLVTYADRVEIFFKQ